MLDEGNMRRLTLRPRPTLAEEEKSFTEKIDSPGAAL
jgi:hypothetical protein